MRRNAYAEAAERYRDPLRIGTALYRAGEFKEAAQVFGRLKSPEGQFNRGNALVMQGENERTTDLRGEPLVEPRAEPEVEPRAEPEVEHDA